MKKNRMMRLASGLLVAVLATTSMISGTYAKYVTQNDANDSARVAKFGVVIQADGALYDDQYATTINTPSTSDNIAELSVKGEAADNVVAPGTKNTDGLAFSINGTPEVRTKLDVEITAENIYLNEGKYAVMVAAPTVSETSFKADTYYTETSGNYTLAAAFEDGESYYTMENYTELTAAYYPVVYTADLTTGTINDDSLNAIAADYARKLNDNTSVTGVVAGGKTTYTITEKEYDPNFSYASLGVENDVLKWEWAFENSGMDGADTILGDLMAGSRVVKVTDALIKAPEEVTDYYLNTSFSINITVTQVD